MEKLFSKLTIALTATKKEGRYVMHHYEWPITKDTPKTLVVKKHHGDHKFLKNEILKAKPVRRNDKFTELGFQTVCYAEDVEEAKKLLKNAITSQLKELAVLQINTIAAWEQGVKEEKID
jgi:hypothetical protein